MDNQAKQTPEAVLRHRIYGAFMEACKEQGGIKEPLSNPWGDLEFYQVLDLLADRAAKEALKESE